MNRRGLVTCVTGSALLALLAVFALRHGRAQDRPAAHAAPAAADCGAMWRQGIEVDGLVGGRRTQAYLDMSPIVDAPAQVSGVLRFPDDRAGEVLADTVIGLAGPPPAEDGCAVALTQRDADNGAIPWRLRVESAAQLTGSRRMPNGRTEQVVLTIVPPTSCDAAGEWRTFSSPKWPIAFDYPASWTLVYDDDDITVECSSIASLATTQPALIFERGHFQTEEGVQRGAPGAATQPYWFVALDRSDWRVGPHGCDGGPDGVRNCPPARRSEHNGMTVLQAAAGDHRLHRPGVGPLGPGRGITRYLFILGELWVSLDSAGENSHYDDVGRHGGPVLFDGETVGDRVVRSVRVR